MQRNVKREWQLIVLTMAMALSAAAQSASGDLRGAGRQAVRRPDGAEINVRLRFVQLPGGAPVRDLGAGQGALDLGSVSYLGGAVSEGVSVTRHGRRFTIATIFGITTGPENADGTATLLANVTQPEAQHRVLLDGVPLQLAPQVIQVGIKPGATSQHRLQIEVPADAPESAASLLNAIALQLVPKT
jgi:hypothetical protein